MIAPADGAERSREAAQPPAPSELEGRRRLCRSLVYLGPASAAAISVAMSFAFEAFGPRRPDPPPELLAVFGINAFLGAAAAAAGIVFLWPVSRERWARAAACLVFCPVIYLGAGIAMLSTLGCLGLIR
jgi:hypothetical protein